MKKITFVAITLTVFVASLAHAALPLPISSDDITIDLPDGSEPASQNSGPGPQSVDFSRAGGHGVAQSFVYPITTVIARSNNNIGATPNASVVQAYADEIYYFSISGPSNLNVPIKIISHLSSHGGVGYGGDAFMRVDLGNLGPTILVCAVRYYSCDAPTSEAVTESVTVQSNTLHSIEIQATASSALNGFGSWSKADSYIVIDPAFLANHPGYSLIVSPGVSLGVPEPTSWAMMTLGVASLGACLRLRRFAVAKI